MPPFSKYVQYVQQVKNGCVFTLKFFPNLFPFRIGYFAISSIAMGALKFIKLLNQCDEQINQQKKVLKNPIEKWLTFRN